MAAINRRSAMALGLGVIGAGNVVPKAGLAQTQSTQAQTDTQATQAARPSDVNPVAFWSEVSLDLNALDHSLPDATDARAPGPCASAYALGLTHAVIADAAKFAYGASYQPLLRKSGPSGVRRPELFVGGAAAAILSHIYSNAPHATELRRAREEFLQRNNLNNSSDWAAGVEFGRQQEFRSRWNFRRIFALIDPTRTDYSPGPRQHHADPWNCTQGYYGQRWSTQAPLVLSGNEVERTTVPAPPAEGSPEYETNVAQVKAKGVRVPSGANARTAEETAIGLFWAYDGARLIGTPPRLYNQILYELAKQDRLSVPELARMLAICNLAMADAGVVCWRGKYRWAVWRPVVGVQNHRTAPIPTWQPLGSPRTNRPDFSVEEDEADAETTQTNETSARESTQSLMAGGVRRRGGSGGGGGRPAEVCKTDVEYMKAAFTPNFPAYPSGHATFGAACFDAYRRYRQMHLRNTAPDRIDITFVSDELNGFSIDNFEPKARPRDPVDFDSIEDMITENADSRVFLGVHWQFDATSGVTSGKSIAEIVAARAYTG